VGVNKQKHHQRMPDVRAIYIIITNEGEGLLKLHIGLLI